MSSFFELNPEGWNRMEAEARARGFATEADIEPGFFEGMGRGLFGGIGRGEVNTVDFLDTIGPDASSAPEYYDYDPAPKGLDPEVQKELQQHFAEETRKKALLEFTPEAHTVGTVGRVLGGLGEMVVPLTAGGGNPSLLVGSTTLSSGKRLIDEGVDAQTAGIVSAVEGASTYAGVKIPVLGKTLGQRVFTGMGGNLALGMGQTFAEQKILEGNGYEELAQQYDPLDVEGRTVDLLLGAVFGGMAHAGMKASERDAVLTAANARHYQVDTAPGRPLDAAASAAHQKAMATALDQLDRGEPVSVDPQVMEQNFEPRPARAAPDADVIREAIGDIPEPREVETTTGAELSPTDPRVIEGRFAEQIAKDPEAAVAAYKAIPETNGGRIINADLVRELSPDYLADRTRSAAVHEPASALSKELFARALKEAPAGSEVVLAAGGAGSGKSTGLNLLGITDQVVLDGTLSKQATAERAIEQVLESGHDARILYTYRDPVEAFQKGVLSRAAREEGQFGSGRAVPLDAFIEGHKGAREVIGKLMEKYRDNPRVKFDVIDNSRGQGEARPVQLEELPPGDYNGLREKLSPILEEGRASGAISEAVYHGTVGKGESGRVRAESRGQSKQERPQQDPDAVEAHTSPTIEAARRLLAEKDVQIPTGEVDADGKAITVSGRELAAKWDQDIATAEKESTKFEAAISCFLTNGES